MHTYIHTYITPTIAVGNGHGYHHTDTQPLAHPMEEHDDEEDGEEVVRVEEDLVLRPPHFIGRRRVDDQHGERHDCPGQVRSALENTTKYTHASTYIHKNECSTYKKIT